MYGSSALAAYGRLGRVKAIMLSFTGYRPCCHGFGSSTTTCTGNVFAFRGTATDSYNHIIAIHQEISHESSGSMDDPWRHLLDRWAQPHRSGQKGQGGPSGRMESRRFGEQWRESAGGRSQGSVSALWRRLQIGRASCRERV